MKQLKSITLSNIRRFGCETTIKLSPGATIILAPNGTGKTAFFEAIEFGLTGKISRLGDDLSPIIRDSQAIARVSLDFGEAQASAQVNNTGEVKTTGDLSSLFPDTNSADIPFLLRLTHLLDQREGEWLVKADTKVAGSQLARLPVGKDGNQVNSALSSIRRKLTEQLRQAKNTLTGLEAEFNEWQSLSLERDLAASQSQGALRSKEHIAESISDIAHKVQNFEQLPTGLLAQPLSLDRLDSMHDALVQLVKTKLDQLLDQMTRLAEVDGLIGRFTSEQTHSALLGNNLITVKQELVHNKQEQIKVADNLKLLQQELVTVEGEHNATVLQLNQHLEVVSAIKMVEQCKKALESADESLARAESQVSALRSDHQGHKQLGIQHDTINRQRNVLLQIDDDLLKAHQLLALWEETLQKVADVTSVVTSEKTREEALQKQLQTAGTLRIAAELEEQAAKTHYEILASASDAVRQAVASIAAHLPKERGDCPLCGEEHGPVELHKRVSEALKAIDPKVVEAELRAKRAIDALRECTDAVIRAETELRGCKGRIGELELELVELAANISGFRNNSLLGGDTVSVVKESIQRRKEVNALAKLQLDEKQHNLMALPSIEVFEKTQNAYNSAVLALNSAQQTRSEAHSRLEHATAKLSVITADAPLSKTVEELSLTQNQKVNQLAELNTKITTEQSAWNRLLVQETDVISRISELEKQQIDAQSRLATARASWRQLSFAGDPNIEAVSSREVQLQSDTTELARHLEKLQSIKIEISAWKSLEQVRLAQSILDRRRGEFSEDEFTINLRQRVDNELANQNRLAALSGAMDTLNQCLSSEITNVRNHVLAVVPRWQALLKRVVREQRFTETILDFHSLYRKEHAEVSVPLNGAFVPVPAIASEAQLTDLQLTFLLSMALDHQWSSWRGLLLDDPTQHHDLVHAASVFDVLRDYIVDHGFQVVIATHDALQARYFMRKLQNDGIEARIWSLAPSLDGVTASESSWPSKM